MDPRDVLTRPAEPPDMVVRYGDHADAVIDVHLPPGASFARRSSYPLIVLWHGGFWRVEYDRLHTRPLANALAQEGSVVATPEYRRVGGRGALAGGWPSTFADVADATAALPGLLHGLEIDISTTTLLGHSAGGQLALWLATEPHPVDRVVALAPVGDLRAAAHHDTGSGATVALLGGTPHEVPERYDTVDPATRLAEQPDCEIVVVHGSCDEQVPVRSSRGLATRFPFLTLVELPDAEHFGLIDPSSTAWPVVLAAVSGSELVAR